MPDWSIFLGSVIDWLYTLNQTKTKFMIIQLCGLSGAGKSTLAKAAEKQLSLQQFSVEILDGDDYRQTLCRELGFSKKDRVENLRRISFVAARLSKHGVIAIICAINPYEEMRQEIRNAYPYVKTVFVDCSLDTLKKRDTKGLYKKAFLPQGHPEKLDNLTGVNDPFDTPHRPDLYLNTERQTIQECTRELVGFISNNFVFPVKNFQRLNTSNQKAAKEIFGR
ncbi:MAG TPA: adenylyl-sulfate kinase [Chitinophagaceae bacterium]